MHVRTVRIDGSFKAFSGLQINDLPPARMVILVGPNGSGKSSIFDALLYWANSVGRPRQGQLFTDYYAHPDGSMASHVSVEFHDQNDLATAGQLVHVRSAYRYTHSMRMSGVSKQRSIKDEPVVSTMNDQDSTATRHYQALIGRFLKIMSDLTQERQLTEIRSEIARLGVAVNKLFPDLKLENVGDALDDGSFFFSKKGISNFRFDNLSSGEKAAFDLLLDLFMSGSDFANGIICLDEPETHLNPRVQAQLLDAITDLVPETCQVWIATHSVGLLRRALEMYKKDSNSVCFLSFEGAVPGTQAVLAPSSVDRRFWRSVLAVALDDLATLISPETVYLCEGSVDPGMDRSSYAWDAQIYRRIFGERHPTIDFVSVGGKSQLAVASEIATIVAPGSARLRIRDRDDLPSATRAQMMRDDPSLRILERRSLESYLVDDEILQLLVNQFGLKQGRTINDIQAARDAATADASRSDDAKRALGAVFQTAKSVLQDNSRLGENKSQFGRDVLAPLIAPTTAVYRELEEQLNLKPS